MELESDDGAVIPLDGAAAIELGRRLAPPSSSSPYSSDRTVSIRHLALRFPGGNHDAETSLSFEVVGKNPIFVLSLSGGAGRSYRNSERGELRAGDRFSLSIKNPFFFKIRQRGVEKTVLDAVERREKRTAERRERERESVKASAQGGDEEQADGEIESDLGSLDVSQIDPVREFGFLVKGHEFDNYPRHKIRTIKDWKWFLEEPGESGDEDEVIDEGSMKEKKVGRRRKRKGGRNGGDDEGEWTEESDEGKIAVGRVGGDKRPKYATRSKDPKKLPKDSGKQARKDGFDEEDETLGGFIVDEENEDGEEEEEEEEEEEAEEDEDEYDDDD